MKVQLKDSSELPPPRNVNESEDVMGFASLPNSGQGAERYLQLDELSSQGI